MNFSPAGSVYLHSLLAVITSVVFALVVDFLMWINNEQTVSQFLREHPGWFLWPLVVTQLLLALLTTHLFSSR